MLRGFRLIIFVAVAKYAARRAGVSIHGRELKKFRVQALACFLPAQEQPEGCTLNFLTLSQSQSKSRGFR